MADTKTPEEINALWEKEANALFRQFIKTNVGYQTDGTTPACFGSGDARKMCKYCTLQATC